MAKPGLPKKYAKMGFARGWKAFKRAIRERASKLKKPTKKKTSSNKTTAKKSSSKAVATKPTQKKKSPGGKSKMKILSRENIDVLQDIGTITIGAAVSNTVTNMVVPAKTDGLFKGGGQILAGLIAIPFVPGGKTVKKFVGGGLIAAGFLNLMVKFFPKMTRFGRGRAFSPSEMNRLQKGYGDNRYKIQNRDSMNKPVNMNKPVDMNKPVNMAHHNRV